MNNSNINKKNQFSIKIDGNNIKIIGKYKSFSDNLFYYFGSAIPDSDNNSRKEFFFCISEDSIKNCEIINTYDDKLKNMNYLSVRFPADNNMEEFYYISTTFIADEEVFNKFLKHVEKEQDTFLIDWTSLNKIWKDLKPAVGTRLIKIPDIPDSLKLLKILKVDLM